MILPYDIDVGEMDQTRVFDEDYDKFIDALQTVNERSQSDAWLIGDLIYTEVEKRFPACQRSAARSVFFDQIGDDVVPPIKSSMVRKYYRTSKVFTITERYDDYTWWVHCQCAHTTDPLSWMNRIISGEVSASDLSEHVKAAKGGRTSTSVAKNKTLRYRVLEDGWVAVYLGDTATLGEEGEMVCSMVLRGDEQDE